MIIFETIELKWFRNIKHIKLTGLRDLNILIGPNNCGKTNFLEFISHCFNRLELTKHHRYLCDKCENLKANTDIEVCRLYLTTEDFYLNDLNRGMEVALLLNEESVNRLVPGVLEKQREKLKSRLPLPNTSCESIKDEIIIKQLGTGSYELLAVHCSPFIHRDIIEEIKRSILYCPEKRLQNYKEKEFSEYIRELRLTGAQKRKWIYFLSRYIDSRINDERYENLIIKIDEKDFESEISKQGSGVRSLVCLATDILFKSDKRVVMIDEPELGLNPFVKQEFLKFLLNESKERQIFIATQDPTFVNPILWKNYSVAVYFYSVLRETFLKIDLNQNQEDPNIFSGYLPHTVSLKDIHIYVEGTSDVYILQILLEKYLKKTSQNWFEILNKIGIYHLCGSFWTHLLYTIPKPPYKCIIILDGDKRKGAKKLCEKYNNSVAITSKFVFCETIEDVGRALFKEVHPIYCLKESCIEKYIVSGFDCANPPQDYNKKVDGPKKAEELSEIPDEIGQLFEMILGTIGLGMKRYVFVEDQASVRDSPNVFP